MPAAVPIVLSAAERHRLKQLARSYTLPLRLVLRASIVRLAAAGRTNASIADRLNVKVDTVRKWRARFAARRLDGLADAPRSGRPPRSSALQRAEVTALACQVPAIRSAVGPVGLPRAGRPAHRHRGGAGNLSCHRAPDPARRCD